MADAGSPSICVATAPISAVLRASRREISSIRFPEGGSVAPTYACVRAASEDPRVGTGSVNPNACATNSSSLDLDECAATTIGIGLVEKSYFIALRIQSCANISGSPVFITSIISSATYSDVSAGARPATYSSAFLGLGSPETRFL